ncbi:Protein TOXD [Penicillium verhagenii]|nr:Protein TOXD [Penicillium verhagenii]
MSTQKAVVVTEPGKAELVTDRPIPTLRDDYLLVKTVAVGLNPTDWKSIARFAPAGVQVGCDFSGIVEAVGKGVKKQWKKGDRVCGFAHGSNQLQPEDGAFAEHIVVKGDVVFRLPENLTFQEGATLGVGIVTIGHALYKNLKLALPNEPTSEPAPILIYGGSTATGTLAIQFAKLSGYTVLAACSPHNFDLVRGLGADAVFNSRDPKAAAEIKEFTNDNLKLVFDCIGLEPGIKFCEEAISSGGDYSHLLRMESGREDVNHHYTLGYTVLGDELRFGDIVIPAKPEDRAHTESFIPIVETILAEGKIKVHPPNVGKGGLRGVLEGLDALKNDKVSGEKLVYNVEDTL